MKKNQFSLPLLLLITAMIGFFSCTKGTFLETEEELVLVDSTRVNTEQEAEEPMDTGNAVDCDTMSVSYSTLIVPLIQDHCLDCHSGEEPFGGVSLHSYEGVRAVVDDGRFYGAVAWQMGYQAMPQGKDQLPACTLEQIKVWIDAGAPNG